MTKKNMFYAGEKVTYKTPYKSVKGIVKRISNKTTTFVVYNCGKNWENYTDFTAEKTNNKDLIHGWEA